MLSKLEGIFLLGAGLAALLNKKLLRLCEEAKLAVNTFIYEAPPRRCSVSPTFFDVLTPNNAAPIEDISHSHKTSM